MIFTFIVFKFNLPICFFCPAAQSPSSAGPPPPPRNKGPVYVKVDLAHYEAILLQKAMKIKNNIHIPAETYFTLFLSS
jgi:hypothetical protein